MTDLSIVPLKELHNKNDGMINKMLPQHPFTCCLVAPRGSGKTTLIANLLLNSNFYYRYFHKVYIFCPTRKMDSKWDYIQIPDDQFFDEFDEQELQKIIDEQIANNEEVDPDERRRILIIFDDLADEFQASRRRSPLTKLFFNGRHLYISVLLTSQTYKQIPLKCRKNTSNFIIYPVSNKDEIEAIYKEQAGHLSKTAFKAIIDDATSETYNFLFIDNQNKDPLMRYRKNFSDKIYLKR